MRANEPPGEVVTVPAHQKETEIFIIEETLSYANYTVWRHNFAVLRNSVNSPVTHRSDSIQGTDYIANDYTLFLNLRVTGTKIENL